MDLKELSTLVRNSGIVGAGGAGFPTYVKIDERADIILMNCAECEPLLKLHRQLLQQYAEEIVKTFQMMAETVKAKEAIIGIKGEYKEAIEALQAILDEYPLVRLHLLPSAYPMGDEVILIYEATGRVIQPGGLPIEEGVAVFNVETVYNIYRAVTEKKGVTSKVVSVVGEIENPITVRVPLGCTLDEVVALAGKITTKDYVYLVGGPMMGKIGAGSQPVTKTTNAILVLPKEHLIIQRKNSSTSINMKRAASSCCQCQMCSDLCPRHLLGHPIEPHKFMRAAANQDFQDTNVYLNTLYCSACGLCEMFSCPQGLSPRTLIGEYKAGLAKNGIRPTKQEAACVSPARDFRRAPEERLEARLGLSKYNLPAPLDNKTVPMKKVKVLLSQHIGAPAKAVVTKGEQVKGGQVIASPAEGLSVAIHAPITGVITDVTETYITVKCNR